MKKTVCCSAHNKKLSTFALFGSAHSAVGNKLKALAATGTVTPLSAISPKTNLNLATLIVLENKTSAGCAYKNKNLRSFLWRVALYISRPKCSVLLTTDTSPVLHTTSRQELTLNKTSLSHIPWLWLLFNSTLPINNSHQTDSKNKQKEKGTETTKPD